MYVRIAHFEETEDNWDERIAEVRSRIQSNVGRDGSPVKRALMLIDRKGSRGASLIFCESEADLQKADQFMDSQQVPGGGGRRTSVEMYEVAVDSEAGAAGGGPG